MPVCVCVNKYINTLVSIAMHKSKIYLNAFAKKKIGFCSFYLFFCVFHFHLYRYFQTFLYKKFVLTELHLIHHSGKRTKNKYNNFATLCTVLLCLITVNMDSAITRIRNEERCTKRTTRQQNHCLKQSKFVLCEPIPKNKEISVMSFYLNAKKKKNLCRTVIYLDFMYIFYFFSHYSQ